MNNLTYIASAEDSKKLNDRHEPMIIISASGMCEGGRIRHHLKNNLGDAKNLVLFIGYCAEGTLGNQIVAGKTPVNIFGEPCSVRAKIISLDTYSGHADKNELKRYVEKLSGDLKKIVCIHGEETQCLAHAETLRAMKPKAEVIVPAYKQVVEI
jgi:metallo-beta-lactamase family protein